MDHGWVLSVTAASAPAFRWRLPRLCLQPVGKFKWVYLVLLVAGWLAFGRAEGGTNNVFSRALKIVKDHH